MFTWEKLTLFKIIKTFICSLVYIIHFYFFSIWNFFNRLILWPSIFLRRQQLSQLQSLLVLFSQNQSSRQFPEVVATLAPFPSLEKQENRTHANSEHWVKSSCPWRMVQQWVELVSPILFKGLRKQAQWPTWVVYVHPMNQEQLGMEASDRWSVPNTFFLKPVVLTFFPMKTHAKNASVMFNLLRGLAVTIPFLSHSRKRDEWTFWICCYWYFLTKVFTSLFY